MSGCFHGGAFWDAIGPELTDLDRRRFVINADVLDAWFPPSPKVIQGLEDNAGWLCKTSPPTRAEGLKRVIAQVRGIPESRIALGAGSSCLLFAFFRTYLFPGARILLVEPTYGEYAHLARLAGCEVRHFQLDPKTGFRLNVGAWISEVRNGRYDLVVLVNPNNPVGTVLTAPELERMVAALEGTTKMLIDEAYIDYVPEGSCESLAATQDRVFVVKSLSKGLALSGLRVAYMVGAIDALARWCPPWQISLPAQYAAVWALTEPDYYLEMYERTACLRRRLVAALTGIGEGEVWESRANWVLWKLPGELSADTVVRVASEWGIFLRNAGATAPSLGDDYVRIAVLEEHLQDRIVEVLKSLAKTAAFSNQ